MRVPLLSPFCPLGPCPVPYCLVRCPNRYAHTCLSLVILGRSDVMHTVNIINYNTLQRDVGGSNDTDTRMASIVPQLKLSMQQLDRIAAGVAVYTSMLDAVQAERQKLQIAAGSCAGGSNGSTGSSGSSTSSHSGIPAGAGVGHADAAAAGSDGCGGLLMGAGGTGRALEGLMCRQQELQAQQQQMVRLQHVLQKEYVVRAIGSFYFAGCLNVEQLARAAVLSWPYFWRPNLLAAEACKYRQSQLSQMAEQPQQEQQR